MAKVATGPLLDISRGARLDGEVRPHARVPLWHHFREGQLLEVSGAAPGKLSTVARLVAHAQGEGEPCAWILARDEAGFYPPDFALMGIDLAALAVVRVPKAAGAHAQVRAAEVLMRSGAFGLVVIDFAGVGVPRGALAWQARLSGLARMHAARIVLLTPSGREVPSLGPLVGLRVEPELRMQSGRALLTQHVLKSKLGVSAQVSPDARSAPPGALAQGPGEALQSDGEGGFAAWKQRGAERGDATRRPPAWQVVREARRVRG